ncbi:MAG: thioesterase family protein [Myxococcota bacterium]
MAFRSERAVRFGDEDHAQLVYYPRFLHFFHCVFEDLFDARAEGYRTCLERDRVGWPAVRVETDFLAPVRFGDRLLIDLWTARLGEKSVTMAYRGVVAGRTCVRAEITQACVAMEGFVATPIPAAYRALFEGVAAPPDDLARG